ncbi:hypothetical protein SMACR_06882 [Sordaria macrospora]|uniref:WGS project CABT00000000 data, contig 2.38 n=2 Tax=Sordaria macrospora TaxID=5147 RepID=F7W793_SORMK|nr:uncharacterized protein SMAC_06882 [Sordaria macrospora k-hell]KAA8633651.1 hypothetical protein SMACR_06882 [Sordaria macrospora]WPJ59593.1 hypothetical protein SMAC4_06882 [Sordaria macrospora]CCC13384.1 unnamed protein product [Sordaria macrospora k-hell]
MTQSANENVRKGAKRWATFLLDTQIKNKRSVKQVLQHLAEAYHKRVARVWDSSEHSIAWRNYFVAALQKVSREMPHKDCSTEELLKEIARMKAPVEIVAPPKDDDGNKTSTRAVSKNLTEAANKPVDASTTGTDPSAAPTDGGDDGNDDANDGASNPVDTSTPETSTNTTRRLLSTTTTCTESGIIINTQGECNAQVMPDGTIQFRLGGPATVTYRPSVTTSTTSGTGISAAVAAAMAAAAAQGTPSVSEDQVNETTTTTTETVEEFVDTSSVSSTSTDAAIEAVLAALAAARAARGTPLSSEPRVHETTTTTAATEQTVEEVVDSSSRSSSDSTSTVRDTPSGTDPRGDDTYTVHGTPSTSNAEAPSTSGTATFGNGAADEHPSGTPGSADRDTPTGRDTAGDTSMSTVGDTPSTSQAVVHTCTCGTTTSTSGSAVVNHTSSGTSASSRTATPGVDAAARRSRSPFQSLDQVIHSETPEETPDAAAHVTLWGPQADTVRGTGTPSALQNQTQTHHASAHTSTFRAAVARDTPSGTAEILRGTGAWAHADLVQAAQRQRSRVRLAGAMIYDLGDTRVEELLAPAPVEENVEYAQHIAQTLLLPLASGGNSSGRNIAAGSTRRFAPEAQVNNGTGTPGAASASAAAGDTGTPVVQAQAHTSGTHGVAAGDTAVTPLVAQAQVDSDASGTSGAPPTRIDTPSVAADEGHNWDPFSALVEAAAAATRLETGGGPGAAGDAPADKRDGHNGA